MPKAKKPNELKDNKKDKPKSYKGVVLTELGWCNDFDSLPLGNRKFYKTANECAIAINGVK